jgi:diacylglycerol kinase (ATP)
VTVVMVVNPASANGRTAQQWPDIARRASELGLQPDVRLTEHAGHAAALTREALEQGARVIVAVGGDGTVSEVVNGFFDGDRPVAPQAELAIVSRGSGCDFIRTYGIPKPTEQALRVAAGARVRTIDVGTVEFTGHDGHVARRRFANVASAGLTGVVAEAANRSSKRFGATAAFAWATVSSFIGYRNTRFHVRIDERDIDRVCNNVIVANGRYFAGGMHILPMAEPDDGALDVLVWGDVSRADLARNLHRLYRGTHIHHPKADISRAHRVQIETTVPLPIEVDGEVPGTTPATFGVQAQVLRLRVP